jgi:hypothetical protein
MSGETSGELIFLIKNMTIENALSKIRAFKSIITNPTSSSEALVTTQ